MQAQSLPLNSSVSPLGTLKLSLLVNGIYLNIIRHGEEEVFAQNANALNDLVMLANTCPYLNGNAVYKARTMVAHYDPLKVYDDMELCNSTGVYRQAGTGNKPNSPATVNNANGSVIGIYPNPSDGLFSLEYKLPIGQAGQVVVYDLLGKPLFNKTLSANSTTTIIDLQGKAQGVYSCKVSINNKIYVYKVVLQ
jgi:hypothetical protein